MEEVRDAAYVLLLGTAPAKRTGIYMVNSRNVPTRGHETHPSIGPVLIQSINPTVMISQPHNQPIQLQGDNALQRFLNIDGYLLSSE